MDIPETRYAERPDGISIAYQVVGNGPRDLIYVPGFISHLDLTWADPGFARFMRRLTGFARVIMFDKPGTGLSDPVPHPPPLEERASDIGTVLDAAGIERAVVMGFSEGAPASLMFAATWRERVEALVLYGGLYRRTFGAEELAALGASADVFDVAMSRLETLPPQWGRGLTADIFAPSVATAASRTMFGRYERAAASPRMIRSLIDAVATIDVSTIAPTVDVPALVLHRTDDLCPVAGSRWVSQLLPSARYVELPGADHLFWVGDCDLVADEIEQFLTGARGASDPDRMLATILFTDLVDSTRRAAELGDAAWRQRLEAHDALVRREVEAFRGRVVKAMGDGHLCVFDGPARAVRCAFAIRDAATEPVRAGVHTGECEVIGEDLGGLAVHIGARVGAIARGGEVLVSSTVKDLVAGAAIAFADRGEHELKGVPGAWRLYAAGPADAPPPVDDRREVRPGDRALLRANRAAPSAVRTVVELSRRLGRPRR